MNQHTISTRGTVRDCKAADREREKQTPEEGGGIQNLKKKREYACRN